MLHFCATRHNCQLYLPKLSASQVLELTLCTQIHSRWRDLSESSGEAIAHDNQSLDSGVEGPDEPDRPEQHPSPSGESDVPTSHFTSFLN